MKKNNNKMMNPEAQESRTVFRTGVKDKDQKETVVACGYSQTGEFGYFICKELVSPIDESVFYSDEIMFKKKTNERTYQEVLAEVRQLLENNKKQ